MLYWLLKRRSRCLVILLWSWAISIGLTIILLWCIIVHKRVVIDTTAINLNRFIIIFKIYLVINWSWIVVLLERIIHRRFLLLLEWIVHSWTCSWLSLGHSRSSGNWKLWLPSWRKRSTTTSTSCHGCWFMIPILSVSSKSIWFINWNLWWFIYNQRSRFWLFLSNICHCKTLILGVICLVILLIIVLVITFATFILCTPIKHFWATIISIRKRIMNLWSHFLTCQKKIN